ncbi:MAG: tetratricopeptide repeat protein [Mariniphaga sp.]
MLSPKNQYLVRCGLFFILVLAGNPAFSVQINKDTLAERLLKEGQYRIVSEKVAAQLKDGTNNVSNNYRLFLFNTLGMAQFRLNNFDSAIFCARQALKLSSDSKDSALISETWKVMSYSFNRLGKLDSAIYFSNKLRNYAKRSGNDRQYRNSLVSLGTILMQNHRPAEALENFLEANSVNKKMRDTASCSIDYFNIGLVYLKLGQYDNCLKSLEEALEILQKFRNPDLLFMTYGTMADCYLVMGKKKERKKYVLLSIEVAKQIGSSQFMAMCYCNLIEGNLNDREFSTAVKNGFVADSLLKKEPFPVQQMKLDSMMYVAYKNLSKPEEALARHESFMRIKNQVLGENEAALLNRMVVEYSVKGKNLRIEKQNVDIQSKTRQLQLLVLLLVVVALFTGRVIYQNIKLRNFRESLYRKEKYLDNQIAVQSKLMTNIATEPDAFAVHLPEVLTDTNPDELTDVDPGLFDVLYLRILSVLETQKLYLDPEMSIKSLINLLGTNKTYLYQAISRNSAENFRGLINRYRVNEAKRIIEKSIAGSSVFDGLTLYSDTGFNSAASFFRAFKQYTGLTPKEYADETRKELRKHNVKRA